MTARRIGRWQGTVSGALLIAAVVAIIVGHDLAMAGDAHAAGEGRASGAAHHGAAPPARMAARDHTPRTPARVFRERERCGVDREAVPAVQSSSLTPADNGVFLSLSDPAAVVAWCPPATNPSIPPGVRRALLQVYRI